MLLVGRYVPVMGFTALFRVGSLALHSYSNLTFLPPSHILSMFIESTYLLLKIFLFLLILHLLKPYHQGLSQMSFEVKYQTKHHVV